MKYNSFLKLLTFVFVSAFIATSCVKEGPQGIQGEPGTNGTNGTDGVDGQVTCLVCHSGTNMDAKKAQFAMSEHKAGAIAVDYAGGRAGCAQCHSHEGFVQYAVFGEVLGDISKPSAWECSTCHGLHKSFEGKDYALRLTDPVVSAANSSVTLDMGNNSNLCINCHQARTAEPNTDKPGETFKITSAHYGPHHGPQGNVVAGVGFAEIVGDADYPAPGSNVHLTYKGDPVGCTACHMGDYNADLASGGHTWNPNLNACITCHDAPNMTNFDYGSTQSDVQDLLDQIRDKLVELGVVEFVNEESYELNPETGEIEKVVTPGRIRTSCRNLSNDSGAGLL